MAQLISIVVMQREGEEYFYFSSTTLNTLNIDDVYFTIELDGKWGIMDSNFNIVMPDMNSPFVEFRGKKIRIKNGNVT